MSETNYPQPLTQAPAGQPQQGQMQQQAPNPAQNNGVVQPPVQPQQQMQQPVQPQVPAGQVQQFQVPNTPQPAPQATQAQQAVPTQTQQAPQYTQQAPVVPQQPPQMMYDPYTGQPLHQQHQQVQVQPVYDPYTGQLLAHQRVPMQQQGNLSGIDQLRQAEQAQQSQQDTIKQLQEQVRFEQGFDSGIKQNEKLFTHTAEDFRKVTEGLEGKELNDALMCVATKDFFTKDTNLQVLTDADQAYVKAEIKKHDKQVDAPKLWGIMQNAIHILHRLQIGQQYRGAGNAGTDLDNTETPNITAYVKRCREKGAGIQPKPKI